MRIETSSARYHLPIAQLHTRFLIIVIKKESFGNSYGVKPATEHPHASRRSLKEWLTGSPAGCSRVLTEDRMGKNPETTTKCTCPSKSPRGLAHSRTLLRR